MPKRIILTLSVLLAVSANLTAQQPVPLSLKKAVEAAIDPNGNTRVQLAHELVEQSKARANQVRADLLPDISASFGAQSQTRTTLRPWDSARKTFRRDLRFRLLSDPSTRSTRVLR